ncbi:gastrula zinc finger protein XlCGF57.1-like [Pararge aegeria]|uniref:Jg11302 protein n=1 Tax=Pararge aegeria aegeria TaxID=348720 RepID=A0A8S4R3I9_9NEOP|nr:gastrula zinc finger protein XlCGF57.1-like [Pararge aegeria]CAH2230095.1 jg11302 [Pararge aegeria aegeria]
MSGDIKKIPIYGDVKKMIMRKDNKNAIVQIPNATVKRLSVKIKRPAPVPDIVTAISKMPNITIMKGLSGTIKRMPTKNRTAMVTIPRNKTAITALPNVTVVKGLSDCISRTAPNTIVKTVLVKKTPKKIPNKKGEKGDPPISEKHKHCTNLEVILGSSNATPIRSQDGFAYTCCFCNESYVKPADLKTHTMMTHNNSSDVSEFMKKQRPSAFLLKLDITLLKCTLCDESTIDTVEGLFNHLQEEHKKILFTDVKNHIIPFRFGGDQLQCAICPNVFTKYKILLEHMHTHYRNYVCDICNYGFSTRRAMLNHKESHKTGTYECSQCDKVFENPQRRRTHLNAVHKFMNMPHRCGVCNERFKSIRLKDRHMIKVHGKTPMSLTCLACDKIFTSQNSLRIHRKNYHLMERHYQCKECEMNFFTNGQLKNHMVKHTGRKDFQCDVCLKWFTRKTVLREHMRIHANDRRFTCLECGRGFVQKCSWRGHMRTVHGLKADKALSTT